LFTEGENKMKSYLLHFNGVTTLPSLRSRDFMPMNGSTCL